MSPFSLNIKGRIVEYDRPVVMAILNVTPDSFYKESRADTKDAVSAQVRDFINQGADIIDVGAYSSRPGHQTISPDQELDRLDMALRVLREINSDIPVSVDTFRHEVARHAISELGADIINDVSFCQEAEDMARTAADLKAPYILQHCPGTADDFYNYALDCCCIDEIIRSFAKKISMLELSGVNDIILDPGFGFGKTMELNYALLRNLNLLCDFGLPVLAGLSRKSMLTKPLDIPAEKALPATTSANTIALLNGASILRVHDVADARDAIGIYLTYTGYHCNIPAYA